MSKELTPFERADVLYVADSVFGKITVVDDREDDIGLPIGFKVGQVTEAIAWLSREAGIELAEAILEDSDVQPEVLTASGDPREAYNEDVVRLAKHHGTQVAFRYAKGDGSTLETRTVQPVVSVEEHQGDLIAVGFDKDRDDYRAFRLDRISGLVQVGG